MTSSDPLVGVRVPATSANLGPGYDALGIALDVPLVAVAGPRQQERVTSVGLGAGELATGDDNLVWRGVLAWCDHAGTTPPDVSIEVRSEIPLERGMGSSSAAAVAGLVLGRALTGGTPGDGAGGTRVLLRLATDLEGHPDNAAAAIMGGLVVCQADGTVQRATPDPGLRPVLCIPHTRQSTSEARALLPQQVPLAVAAANAARAVATWAGLAGMAPLTAAVMTDELHEPTRLAAMAGSGAVVAALRDAGIPAALSGAGPSVLAVVPARDPEAVDRVAALARTALPEVEVRPTAWDLAGAELCPPGPVP